MSFDPPTVRMYADPPTVRFPVPRATRPRPHILRRITGLIGALLAALVVAAAIAVAVVPALTGASALTVLSGSMEPALPVGSVVVVRPRPASAITVGDIITFTDRDEARGESRVVTHRVIAVEPGPAFRTMGDANEAPDQDVVAAADVRGVRWYSVPVVGLVRDALISPTGAFFAVGLCLLLTAAHLLLPAAAGTSPGNGSGRHRSRGTGRETRPVSRPTR